MIELSPDKESLLGNTRKPDVSFFKNGRIDITSRVARALDLADGDVVDVVRCGSEMYLYVRWRSEDIAGKHTAQCHLTKSGKDCHNFRAFSVKLCRAILRCCADVSVVRLAAGDKVVIEGIGTAIPLITRINLHNNDKRD